MKTKALLLAAILTLTLMAGTASAYTGAPRAPDGIRITGVAGYSLRFHANDFLEILGTDMDGLLGVMVVDLPEGGVLSYAGRSLMENESVTTETLHTLRFVPDGIHDLTTGFTVLPIYESGVAAEPLPISIALERQENHAPVSQDVSIETYRDIAVEGMFSAVDPEGDALVFRVTSKARRGEVEVLPDGTFIYTPFPRKTGRDAFTYVAVDPFGNTSAEARVNVRIKRQRDKLTYADMDGHPAHYAALRLHEEGIFTGEAVCGRHHFRPDEPVSRAEMVVMTLRAAGLEGEVVPVSVTGFADNDDIPAWFKPYAQAAVRKGIVDGEQTPDGRRTMNAHGRVTQNQAVLMLNNAVGTTPSPTAGGGQAVRAAQNPDIIGVARAVPTPGREDTVTRAEAARMLVHAMGAQRDMRTQNGLLSWVFGM